MNTQQQPAGQFDVDRAFLHGDRVSISGLERLRFAKQALCVLMLICVSVFIAYAAFPDNTALIAIFELLKIGILPLVTLVVSFYFPSRERDG